MILVCNMATWGWDHAIRGMRNPMNSWEKSDTVIYPDGTVYLGPNDLDLMRRLYSAGTEHRKYLRQVFVSMDILAPLYWWKEFDTYKIGTTANSCSTMHKIADKRFEMSDFSTEHLSPDSLAVFENVIAALNRNREMYLYNHSVAPWWQMIQLLPTSYNQRRTVTMNYENVFNILHQRSEHKLDEWHIFCDALRSLPHVDEIGGET